MAGPATQWKLVATGVGPAGTGAGTDIETLFNTFLATVAGTSGQVVNFAKYAKNVPGTAVELDSGHEIQVYP